MSKAVVSPPSEHVRPRHASLAILLFGLVVGVLPLHATINEDLWKMKYGVTAAQWGSPAWASLDDDNDGVKNGDELAAGTNPFSASKTIKVSNVIKSGTNVILEFPTEDGKRYRAEATSTLSLPNSWVLQPEAATPEVVMGNGQTKSITVPYLADHFYRIRVDDVDSDGDGITDWAEKVAGYSAGNIMTDGRTADAAAIPGALAALGQVTVSVTKPSATQPPNAATAAVESGSITVSRGLAKLGSIAAPAITVALQKAGSATPGNPTVPNSGDYDGTAVPSSVVFSGLVTKVVIPINPLANSARKTNVTAIVKALPGVGYTVGVAASGSVVINPAGVADGTGLTARYFNTSNDNYGPLAQASDQLDIYGGTVHMNRTDPTVNFSNGANGWGATAGPTGMSPESTAGRFSVRWTGQILPQYSETYWIDFRSDDSAKVWVNNVLLIDRWTGQGATDYVNTINLTGGIPYDIQIDYHNRGGGAEAKLYWWSASQPKQIIPQGRLFPAPAQNQKVTAVTNSLSATGYVSVPFTFNLASPNIGGTGTTYALDANSGPFPPGLPPFAIHPTTGVITGTPTVAGTYNIAVNATNAAGTAVTGSSVLTITIFPTGSVTREILAANGAVEPDGTITTLDDEADYPANTSRRLRGYILPPKTGNYYFWIAANNTAELWISNDSESVNRVRRAYVTASTGKKDWTASNPPSPAPPHAQQSQWLALVAGQRVYFDVLHHTGPDDDDYLAVGWCQDDLGTIPAVPNAPNTTGARTQIPDGGAPLQGYPLSGTVPGYIFQRFDYPSIATSGGPLYAANLGPQGTATTQASGSANLRVEPGASPTSAILHFNYQNLTSPKTAYHLHVDAFGSHPQGEIIYDIDDVDAFHPDQRTADGGYVWNFAPVGTFTNVQQIRDAITQGKVYLNVHSVLYPSGEIRGNLNLIDGSQTPPAPAQYSEPPTTDIASTDAGAARFLNQAAFGASPTDMSYVKTYGFSAWIDNQLTKPASRTANDVVAGLSADINTPYPSTLFTNTWWKYSITGADQLRQRLAFALSEIMVVSWQDNVGPLRDNGRVLADYYDTLLDYCLPTPGLADSGNFRGVIKGVTLTPAMGLFLDMRGNQKEDLTLGRHPNENYARELLQLFSIGINRVWDDGRFVLDSNADVVPVYTQPTILGFAALLTGWNYAQQNQANGRLPTSFGPGADYLNAMVLVPGYHDLNAKLLINNVVTPAATGRTPRVSIGSVTQASPCVVNTSTIHGLKVGDTVKIHNVSGGSFTTSGGAATSINASHVVTEIVDADSFKVGINCTSVTGIGYTNAVVAGTTVLAPTFGTGGISVTTGSQSDNANFTGWALPHPYDQYGQNELETAINNIMENANVAPYVCRQLIQRLVTSDPSPGYVYRVVQKWRDNGAGVQGDLAAVLRQILLDGEARSSTAARANPTFGKQREPMLRLTGPARTFPATNYTGTYTQLTGIDSNKLRITTSVLNEFNAGFTVDLNFRGNYNPAGQTLTPGNVPTSTSYGVSSTLKIAKTSTAVSSISAAPATYLCRVVTSEPHGLATGNQVRVSGFAGGALSSGITTTSRNVTVIDPNTFDIDGITCTTAPTVTASTIMVSNPCRITTAEAHGLTTGDSRTLSGVSGGSFSPTISNATFAVTVVDSTSFTIPVNCTAAATVNTGSIVGGNTLDVSATGMFNVSYSQVAGSNLLTVTGGGPATNVTVPGTTVDIASITPGSPCIVTTSAAHNLVSGGVVNIADIEDGAFETAITGNFVPTVIDGTSFTVPVECTVAPTPGTGTTTKRIRSQVYLHFLTQTNASGAALPTSGIYDVRTVNGSTNFTVQMGDTLARTGNLILPKISSSYTPLSNNTVVRYNTNVNHNLTVGADVWIDAPVVGSPVIDAKYSVATIVDEDHFTTSYLPVDINGGTYSMPSGSNNGINMFPLVPPVLGRSGVVSINQSTFNLGGTDSSLSQSPLNAPTVFNFFFPHYRFPGTLSNSGVDSPEFQLTTDSNVTNLTNSLTDMLIGTGGGNGNAKGLSSFSNGNGSVVMDIGPYMTSEKTANGGIPTLIDDLANLLVGGPLEPATRTTIQNFVTNATYFPMTVTPGPTDGQMRDRVRAIIHLIVTSAEYAVQK